jgi:hypothetical protein
MAMKSSTVSLVAMILLTPLSAATAKASCDDRPGTPTGVTARVTSQSPPMIQVRWTNTATETVFWDVEMTDEKGNMAEVLPAGIGRGDTGVGLPIENTYTVPAGVTRCFRVKARTERHTEGCVSRDWSNRACATTKNCSFGPDTCIQGFVWREAGPDDHVCVPVRPVDVRAQTRSDNTQAAARRSPTGGVFGPDTCLSGFVWREAFPGDQVCVTPETRAQAARDNSLASVRDACP